jgi:hypothetical protein
MQGAPGSIRDDKRPYTLSERESQAGAVKARPSG